MIAIENSDLGGKFKVKRKCTYFRNRFAYNWKCEEKYGKEVRNKRKNLR